MVDALELLLVVNEFDEPLEPRPRHEVLKEGHWHRVAHVWIINDKHELLCQKRSMRKDISPGMWEPFVAGHVCHEDNYFSGAVREVREETGIPVNKEGLRLVKIYKASTVKEFRAIFYLKWNGLIDDVVSEPDEIDEARWIPISTARKHIMDENDTQWFHPGYAKEMLSVLSLG